MKRYASALILERLRDSNATRQDLNAVLVVEKLANIDKALRKLRERGYISVVGERRGKVGAPKPLYGITEKGMAADKHNPLGAGVKGFGNIYRSVPTKQEQIAKVRQAKAPPVPLDIGCGFGKMMPGQYLADANTWTARVYG